MTEQEAYNGTKKHLQDLLGQKGYLPNIKVFEANVRNLSKRIKLVESGSQLFATSVEEAEKAESALLVLKGKHRAFKEITKELKDKIRQSCKD